MSFVCNGGTQSNGYSLAEFYDSFHFFMLQNPPGALVQKVIEYNYGPLELEVIALALRDGLDIESHCRSDSNYLELSDERLKLRKLHSGQGLA